MNIDYVEYTRIVFEEYARYRSTGIRLGQTYFNVLYKYDPELADQIRGTETDPFHRDDRIINFLKQLIN